MDSRFRTVDDTFFSTDYTASPPEQDRPAATPQPGMKRLMRAVWRELGPTLDLMHRSGFRYTPFL